MTGPVTSAVIVVKLPLRKLVVPLSILAMLMPTQAAEAGSFADFFKALFYSTLNLHAVHLWLPIKNFISGNPGIVAIVGVVGTISGIVLAVLFYKLSRPRRLLAYATRTFRVVPQGRIKLQGLQTTYYGYPVESLSVTRLAVWNAGNESIRRGDIPASDRPVIYVVVGIRKV